MKQQLYRLCLENINQRIAHIESAMELAGSSINEETKSSAGDKYETAREMMTQEIEKNRLQLSEAIKQKQLLLQLQPDKLTEEIQPGSVVQTNLGNFYIAISVGRLEVEEKTYMAISPASPIGLLFIDKTKGTSISFNGKNYRIEEVS
ncbi:MAG: 3-oxoacyl-ACP synthase [Bacteroidetes bacterium]|nr:3-oxoacyl-ACP synthase [Bacteroidota bacterium]